MHPVSRPYSPSFPARRIQPLYQTAASPPISVSAARLPRPPPTSSGCVAPLDPARVSSSTMRALVLGLHGEWRSSRADPHHVMHVAGDTQPAPLAGPPGLVARQHAPPPAPSSRGARIAPLVRAICLSPAGPWHARFPVRAAMRRDRDQQAQASPGRLVGIQQAQAGESNGDKWSPTASGAAAVAYPTPWPPPAIRRGPGGIQKSSSHPHTRDAGTNTTALRVTAHATPQHADRPGLRAHHTKKQRHGRRPSSSRRHPQNLPCTPARLSASAHSSLRAGLPAASAVTTHQQQRPSLPPRPARSPTPSRFARLGSPYPRSHNPQRTSHEAFHTCHGPRLPWQPPYYPIPEHGPRSPAS